MDNNRLDLKKRKGLTHKEVCIWLYFTIGGLITYILFNNHFFNTNSTLITVITAVLSTLCIYALIYAFFEAIIKTSEGAND